ncbi:MAG: MBL fold metallo-hydrolase, partial [Solirubrobacteraceae bacterium]
DRFEVAYTPGHASHHVCYRHGETAFVGDVGGVRVTPDSITIPPTPPPDIDVEAWHESIALVRSWRPRVLAITHFGPSEDVEAQLDELDARLDEWAALAHDGGHDAFVEAVRGTIMRDGSPGQAAVYEQAAPVEQLYAGLDRYWRKRAQG